MQTTYPHSLSELPRSCLTEELPKSNQEKVKEWAEKFQAKTGIGVNIKCSCYMCEKDMYMSYANSRRIDHKPTCSDSCRVDSNALKVWLL